MTARRPSGEISIAVVVGIRSVAIGRAIIGDPREAFSPNRPYRPDLSRPWKRGPGPILEMPITSIMGVPLIGSVLAMAGPQFVLALAAVAARRGFVNVELHAISESHGTEKRRSFPHSSEPCGKPTGSCHLRRP